MKILILLFFRFDAKQERIVDALAESERRLDIFSEARDGLFVVVLLFVALTADGR
jgi:hypothetical protein